MFGSQSSTPGVDIAAVPADGYLLDVREDDEWQAGHAPDAVHLALSELTARAEEVPADRDVYVICRAGSRSEQATSYLNQLGHTALNVLGGMMAWEAAGRPMVSEDGSQPAVI
jgi:rhodanese-related sulfurtransferase